VRFGIVHLLAILVLIGSPNKLIGSTSSVHDKNKSTGDGQALKDQSFRYAKHAKIF